MHKSRIAVLAALLLAGTAPIFAQPAVEAPVTKARYGNWGVDLAARDMAVKPGDDFWRYANNSWFQANPIPADRVSWGVGTVLSEDVERQLRAHRRGCQCARRHRSGQPPGLRHVCELDGRGRHRGARRRRAAALSRAHRGGADARRPRSPVRDAGLSRPRSASASRPIPPIRRATSLPRRRAASACPIAIIICAKASSSTAIAPPIATSS